MCLPVSGHVGGAIGIIDENLGLPALGMERETSAASAQWLGLVVGAVVVYLQRPPEENGMGGEGEREDGTPKLRGG